MHLGCVSSSSSILRIVEVHHVGRRTRTAHESGRVYVCAVNELVNEQRLHSPEQIHQSDPLFAQGPASDGERKIPWSELLLRRSSAIARLRPRAFSSLEEFQACGDSVNCFKSCRGELQEKERLSLCVCHLT